MGGMEGISEYRANSVIDTNSDNDAIYLAEVIISWPQSVCITWEKVVLVDQNTVSALLLNSSLKVTELRVLGVVLRDLDDCSFRKLSVSEIAMQLGIDRSRTSLALKVLAQQKIIEQGQKIGRFHTYRLLL